MQHWIVLVLALCIPVVYAADKPTTQSITLEQALVRVLEHNPKLRAAGYESRAAAARIRQARLSASPLRIQFEAENFAGGGTYNGDDALESTLSLVRVLESGDKLLLRGEVAQQEARLLGKQQDAERLDILAETARRFVHVVTDQERLRIANDKLALVERTRDVVEQRVNAGKSPVAERRRVAIEMARADLEREHAEHELATSRLKLSMMWAEKQPDFSMAQAVLVDVREVKSFAQLEQLLVHNPDLVRFATDKRLAGARIRLAQAKRRSDIQLSGGIRYFSDTDDSAFVLSASLPLGSGSRAAPTIDEAQLLLEQQPLLLEQRSLELHASLYEIYQELLHALTAVGTFRDTIIPEAERALSDYGKGYRAGRYSLLELTDAQNTLLEARREAVMAAADYHRFRIEIERLTGRAMSTGVTQ